MFTSGVWIGMAATITEKVHEKTPWGRLPGFTVCCVGAVGAVAQMSSVFLSEPLAAWLPRIPLMVSDFARHISYRMNQRRSVKEKQSA